MSLAIDSERSQRIRSIIANLSEHVQAAQEAARVGGNVDDCRKALNACWFAIYDAQDAINDAERETRWSALEAIGEPHDLHA